MMFKTKGGGGVKGFLNNVQKNCGSGAGWHPLPSFLTYFPTIYHVQLEKIPRNIEDQRNGTTVV